MLDKKDKDSITDAIAIFYINFAHDTITNGFIVIFFGDIEWYLWTERI